MIHEIEKVLNIVTNMAERIVGLSKCIELLDKQTGELLEIVKEQGNINANLMQRVERLERDNRTY